MCHITEQQKINIETVTSAIGVQHHIIVLYRLPAAAVAGLWQVTE
jgi:hypothetical protein